MKFFLWITISCIMVSSCSRKNKTEEEKEQENIRKNYIKTITEYVTVNHLDIPELERINVVDHFNEKGQRLKSEKYKADGTKESVLQFEFNHKEKLVKVICKDEIGNLLYQESRTYDENNNRKDLYFLLPDGSYKFFNTAIHDAEGNMTELKWYRPEGLVSINIYSYSDNKLIKNDEFAPDGKINYTWLYTYGHDDNLISSVQYGSNDSTVNFFIHNSYGVENLLIKQVSGSNVFSQKTVTYEYDKFLLLTTKKEFSASGRLLTSYRYRYTFF